MPRATNKRQETVQALFAIIVTAPVLYGLHRLHAKEDAEKAANQEYLEISKRCSIAYAGGSDCGVYVSNALRGGGLTKLDHYDQACMARVSKCIAEAPSTHPR